MTETEEKLQARLDKAVEVFKEKNEEIDKLNKRIEELNEYIDNIYKSKDLLEKEIKDKDSIISNLKKQIESYNIKDTDEQINKKIVKQKSETINNGRSQNIFGLVDGTMRI